MEEQQVTDNFLALIKKYIDNAKDLLERQFVLTVAEADVKKYVFALEQLGMFENWWKEESIQREAKKFLNEPSDKAVSTLKQEVVGLIEKDLFTLSFHIKCNAKYYYKSIAKNKMSYLLNNGRLVWMKLIRFDRENNRDVPVFEQGLNVPQRDPFMKTHHA